MPVMLTVRRSDGKISVLLLLETPDGLALHEDDRYFAIGQVRKSEWTEKSPRTGGMIERKGWVWYYDEEGYGSQNGKEMTERAAVAAVLSAGNYVEAPPNAVNPGLFPAS